MFFTGTFSIMDGFLLTCQKAHPDGHAFDDDVVSRSAEWERDPAAKDGFVSNTGGDVTIHLKQEYTENDAIVALVKHNFSLSEASGVKSITVAPFYGWENERTK